MNDSNARPRLLRFGVFEVDLRTGELRKQGLKVKLQGQPFQVLAMLLERPGELVTREEIREKLWPEDTFIDFEHSVNNSIKRLREALGDDPAAPRFIETLPRHGYRFIAPVEGGAMQELPLPTTGPRAVRESPLRRHWAFAVASGLVVAVVAVLFALNIAGRRDRVLRAGGAVREPPLRIQSIAVLPFE
ncbi:MAG: winged helix-turn-helix domain-containing protein, partial [Terriglobia bacterium]